MLKGMSNALYILCFFMLSACDGVNVNVEVDKNNLTDKNNSIDNKTVEILLTGQIMLGPVVRGHSLEAVVLDDNGKILDNPKVGHDGSYRSVLKDYDGIVYLQVKSSNPDQCSGDYIDEATAESKCLGNNILLSATVVKSGSTNNQVKIHSTPLTTVAVFSMGVTSDEKGIISLPKNLSKDAITNTNKVVARVFGLGDQSIAEYTPKSIITTDQKFQRGDAYAHTLAAISGLEANGKDLNSIVEQLVDGIDMNTGDLNPATQDMMTVGTQKVFNTAMQQSADNSVLLEINKQQSKYSKSIVTVDLTKTLPKKPTFTNKNKTANQQPTWQWQAGGTGNNKYRYIFANKKDLNTIRTWTQIEQNSFTPKTILKPGKYSLLIQEGDLSSPTLWSVLSESTIEITAINKGITDIDDKSLGVIKEPNETTSDKNISQPKKTKQTPKQIPISKPAIEDKPQVVTKKPDETTPDKNISQPKKTKPTPKETIAEKTIDNDKPDEQLKAKLLGEAKQDHILKVELINAHKAKENSISYTWFSSSNSNNFISNKPSYTLTSDDVGYYLGVLVEYTDLAGKTHPIYLAKKNRVEKLPQKPKIINTPNLSVNMGSKYQFTPIVEDPDTNQSLTFTSENIPTWAIFNPDDGSISGTPQIDDKGIYKDIYITVTDSTELSHTIGPFDIHVESYHFNENAITKINVCWYFLEKGTKYLAEHEVSQTVKNFIKSTIYESWQKHAALSFEGWRNCSPLENANKTSTLLILFYRSEPNSYPRARYDADENALFLNTYSRKHTIIHEFGHALGFPHEHERLDVYNYKSKGNVCSNIKVPLPIVNPKQFAVFKNREKKNLKVINKKQFQRQSYNPFSVMNYCTNATDYFANHVKANNLLSDADINRVQQFYGAPSDTEPHLMDGDDFFTGLYRPAGEAEYMFYKYGAPYNHPKIDLSQIADQQYFVIYDDKQDESFLFKFDNNLQYLKPVNDPIAVCNSLESPNDNMIAVSMNCSAIWDQERYSNNSFYYHDDAYGFTNEFNSLFCEEIEGTPITQKDITYYFLRLSDYDCVDFDQDIYKPFFFTKNKNQLFIKGKGYSGRLDGLPNLSFENGQLKYDRLEQKNNRLKRFNHKDNSFVDYSGYIKTLPNNPSINSGYYIAGSKINERNTKLVNEKIKWGGVDIFHDVIYSFKEQEGRKQLFKHTIPFTGYYNNNSYSNGYKDELEIVDGKLYRFNRENYDGDGNKLHDLLGYQYNPTYFSWHSGFNPSSLGNGKNAYYAQGYPTTMLCRSNGKCSNQNDSIEDIYQKFKDVNKDDIFAWIVVRTQYSKLNVNGKIRPILFKGHNPFTGYFNGNKYQSGYLVMKD